LQNRFHVPQPAFRFFVFRNSQSAIRNPQSAIHFSPACALIVFLAQAALPPLPRLSLDAFPPQTRDALARPYAAATARPTDVDAVATLARTLQAWDQWGAAHETYLRAQALAPQAFAWQYLDGVVLQRLARPTEAVVHLQEALRQRPDYLPARVKLAEAALDAGDLDRARRSFEALGGETGATPAAELGLGRLAAAEGRHEEAVAHLQRAVALFPEWGAAHYALALSLNALGRRDEAARALDEHAKYGARWPALPDAVLDTVTSLRDDADTNLQRGIKLADAGDLTGAIAAHEAALARDPSIAQAHVNLISLYGRSREWARAEEHYRATLALGFNIDEAHYDFGVILGLQDRWPEAEAAYRHAIAVNPSHAQASNNLGQILERTGQFEAAADAYRQAVASRPTLRLARFNLGRMLLALGRPGDAIAELEKLTEPRDAETPRYLFALGTAHVHAGHRDEGIKWATDARELALAYGQQELAAAIERDLAKLKDE
jgi:tetratricopeptide (TPR) repeat protein